MIYQLYRSKQIFISRLFVEFHIKLIVHITKSNLLSYSLSVFAIQLQLFNYGNFVAK